MTRIRLQLDVAPPFADHLDHLVDATGAASRAEVVRRAVALYGRFLALQADGAELRVVTPGKADVVLEVV